MDLNEVNGGDDLQRGRLLTFIIDEVSFGIEMHYITEIISLQNITEMPDIPIYMKGIINLRGRIIPVMDVRLRFCKDIRAYDDRTCIIVINVQGLQVGLIVDSVSEVVTIPAGDISEVPKTNYGQTNRYVKNIAKQSHGIVLVLDCEKLLSDEEIAEIGDMIH